MKYIKNDGNLEDNAVHNRFTAYLKVSLEHNNARYTVKLKQKLFSEIDYPEDEVLSGSYEDGSFEKLFASEIENSRLRRALSALREAERDVLTKHVINDQSLKSIAVEIGVPYPTVKSLYRRALEKMRKEVTKE